MADGGEALQCTTRSSYSDAITKDLCNRHATAVQHIVGPLSSGRERHEASVPNTCSLRAHRTFWKATINHAPSSPPYATVLTRSVSLYSLRDELDTLNCAESKKSSLRRKKNNKIKSATESTRKTTKEKLHELSSRRIISFPPRDMLTRRYCDMKVRCQFSLW